MAKLILPSCCEAPEKEDKKGEAEKALDIVLAKYNAALRSGDPKEALRIAKEHNLTGLTEAFCAEFRAKMVEDGILEP